MSAQLAINSYLARRAERLHRRAVDEGSDLAEIAAKIAAAVQRHAAARPTPGLAWISRIDHLDVQLSHLERLLDGGGARP